MYSELHGMDRSASPNHSATSSNFSISTGDDELKHFSQAKSEIDTVFNEINSYITGNVKSFIDSENLSETSCSSLPGFDCDAWLGLVAKKSNRIKMLSDRVKRNHMKVVFFGRTSNGKSTTINALLQEKLLPSGLGHTTSCFLQVQKTDTGENYVSLENDVQPNKNSDNSLSSETSETEVIKKTAKNINDLANALRTDHLQSDSLGEIPIIPNCRLKKVAFRPRRFMRL